MIIEKQTLIEWVERNYESIIHHRLICTGTTGALIEESLKKKLSKEMKSKLYKTITKLKSGPSRRRPAVRCANCGWQG